MKAALIKRLVDRIIIERHDAAIREELEQDLHRLSYRTLAWLENRIEIKERTIREGYRKLYRDARLYP